jgi:hypothetical protein
MTPLIQSCLQNAMDSLQYQEAATYINDTMVPYSVLCHCIASSPTMSLDDVIKDSQIEFFPVARTEKVHKGL